MTGGYFLPASDIWWVFVISYVDDWLFGTLYELNTLHIVVLYKFSRITFKNCKKMQFIHVLLASLHIWNSKYRTGILVTVHIAVINGKLNNLKRCVRTTVINSQK